MSLIQYYIPPWNETMSQEYINYYKQKTKILQRFLYASNIKKKENIINSSSFDLETIADQATSSLGKIGGLQENIGELYRTFETAKTNAEEAGNNFMKTANKLLSIRNGMLNGKTIVIKNDDDIFAENFSASNLYKQDLKKSIGQVGESTSSIVALSIADAIVDDFVKKMNTTVSGVNIIYQNTGEQRVKSTFSKGTSVQRQTDNFLTINFINDNTGGEVSFSFNISDKASKQLIKPKKSFRATLRTSTVGALSNVINKAYVYNTISLHHYWDKKETVESSARDSLRALFAHYLFVDALKEKRIITSTGEIVEDSISFTVYGTKVIAEKIIYEQLFDQSRKDSLKASIEGISKNTMLGKSRYGEWNVESAQDYISKRRVSLRFKI